jgi:ferredoxin
VLGFAHDYDEISQAPAVPGRLNAGLEVGRQYTRAARSANTLRNFIRDACPSDAIVEQKQLVRGDEKWFVDLDRCIPYFAETKGCAICIARCPWSRPGIADNLLVKLARRRQRLAVADS